MLYCESGVRRDETAMTKIGESWQSCRISVLGRLQVGPGNARYLEPRKLSMLTIWSNSISHHDGYSFDPLFLSTKTSVSNLPGLDIGSYVFNV